MSNAYFSHIRSWFLCGMLPFIMTGCLRVPLYKPKPLTALSGRFNQSSIEKHTTVRVKIMNKSDIVTLFGKRGSWLARNRRSSLIPFHISVCNHSNRSLVLEPTNISMPLVSHEYVCNRMCSKSGWWIFGTCALGYPAGLLLGAGGFLAIPIGAGIGSSSLVTTAWVSLVGGFGLTLATPFIAMGNAVRSAEANREVELDLYEKMLKSNTIIAPFTCFETIVFVKRSDFTRNFTITLHPVDEEANQYISRFHV